MGVIRVGTSGWSYPEWIGPFYPEKTPATRMLPFYAQRFSTVEAHSTYRRLPTPAALTRWTQQAPPEFRFAPKAHAAITHRRDLDGLAERVENFFTSLSPLGPQLGPVLFVLPQREPDRERLDAVLRAATPVAASPVVFELATAWVQDREVLDRLGADDASLAVIDREGDPEAIGTLPAIGKVAYVRLRRASYTPESLARWAERLAAAADRGVDVYVFLKHDDHGDAPRYAQALVARLEQG